MFYCAEKYQEYYYFLQEKITPLLNHVRTLEIPTQLQSKYK